MPHYKNAASDLFFIESEEFEYLLPAGCTKIPENQVVVIQQAKKVAQVSICTPWQMRYALNVLGLRSAVEAAVAASSDQNLKDGWATAQEFRSDTAFVTSMASTVGKTAEQAAILVGWAAKTDPATETHPPIPSELQ